MNLPGTPSDTPPVAPGGWYYGSAGQPTGPVPLPQLQQMARSRQLAPSTLVWTDGMPGWVPAGTLPALFAQASIDEGLSLIVPTGNLSGTAIAAGYLGLLGFVLPILSPIGILCGILGLRDIARYPEKKGKGRAWTGIIGGGVITLIWIAIIVSAIAR